MPEPEGHAIPLPPYIHVEQTLAMIKPDAIDKVDEIDEIILEHGFSILRVRKPSQSFTILHILHC